MEQQPYGEVFDRGYRHYEGQREGRAHAIRALLIYSIKRGLGLKKRWTAKIIPFSLYAIAFLPVIVIIGIRGFLGPMADRIVFGYANLYQMLSLIVLVLAAAVAPEMLCDDRRERVLQLYFARAINRSDYLLAKIGALCFLIGCIALLPALLLFLGNVFLADSPLSYFAEHVVDLGRILAAGTLIGLFYAAIDLTIAAYIDRKGVASATAVGGFLVVSAIVSAMFNTIQADWHRYLVLANPLMVPEGVANWIFGAVANQTSSDIRQAALPDVWFLFSILVVVAVCAGVMYRRYLIED